MKMKAKSLTGLWLSDQILSVLLGLLILRILIIQPLALLGYIHPVLIYPLFIDPALRCHGRYADPRADCDHRRNCCRRTQREVKKIVNENHKLENRKFLL